MRSRTAWTRLALLTALASLAACRAGDPGPAVSGAVIGPGNDQLWIDLVESADVDRERVRSVMTDADGRYAFTGVADGTYEVIPFDRGRPIGFYPSRRTVEVRGASQPGVDFAASLAHTLTGTVTGSVRRGVTLTIVDALGTNRASTVSDWDASFSTDGFFSFRDLPDGRFTIRPTLPLYTFDPPEQEVQLAGAGGALPAFRIIHPDGPPVTTGFFAAAPLSIPRSGHTATTLADGTTLVIGGRSGTTAAGGPGTWEVSQAERFDPATGQFTRDGLMNLPRRGHVATRLASGQVLVTGGLASATCPCASGTCACDEPVTVPEVYDPRTGTFTPVFQVVYGELEHTATPLEDGRGLLAGGISARAVLLDPATGTISDAGPWPRTGHTATLLPGGEVLLAGGLVPGYVGGPSPGPSDTAVRFDPATGAFQPTGPMTLRRQGHTATRLPDGRVLVTGGLTLDRDGFTRVHSASAEFYDPASGTFAATWPLTRPRSGHQATLLSTGQVLITGGEGDPLYAGNARWGELFDPGTGRFSPIQLDQDRNGEAVIALPGGGALLTGNWVCASPPAAPACEARADTASYSP